MPRLSVSPSEGWFRGGGHGRIRPVVPEEIVKQLAAVEAEMARARGLDRSGGDSVTQTLRAYRVRLELSEAKIEARVTVHGPAMQALLVALGERFGVPVYRRPRQRATTLLLSGPPTFVHEVIGPMFQQMSDALDAWFLEQTQDVLQRLKATDNR